MLKRYISLLFAALLHVSFSRAQLVEVTNFGTNPTNLQMFEYVPATVTSPKTLLVLVHYCGGTAAAMYSFEFTTLAAQYGFMVVYPQTNREGQCWDVASTKGLTREGGSDSQGIVAMTKNAISRYGIASNRVFVSGISSGAMMTNVLLAEYPDVFVAGAAFMGVPYTCFATDSGGDPTGTQYAGWNSTCSTGQVIQTAQAWGDLVRAAYPSFTGKRPRMQLWHGLLDEALYFPNFGEEIKQWTNVLGLSQTPSNTVTIATNWTRYQFIDSAGVVQVEGHRLDSYGHELPKSDELPYWVAFMGLNATGTTTTTTTTKSTTTTTRSSTTTTRSSTTTTRSSTTTTRSSTATTTTTTTTKITTTSAAATATSACNAHWAQCGGLTWTGSTTCCSPYTCTYSNAYYSQCL